MDGNDHDNLIKNTALTEVIHNQLTQALQQLGRGNDRFQRMEADHLSLKMRVDQLERDVPQMFANMRADMLRAIGSVVDKTDTNIKAATDPLQKQLEPITEAIARTHTLLKWFGGTVVGLAVGLITAIVIAYALNWFHLN